MAIFRQWAPLMSPLHRQNPKIFYFPLLISPNLAKSSCGRWPTHLLRNFLTKSMCETHTKKQKTKSPNKSFEKGERMQFPSSSDNNDLRRKRFHRMNSNKKECEMVLRMCGLILFQFPMGTYLLEMIMKCFYWHKTLSCKEVEFTMAHNSWLWIRCSSILFLFFILICHPIYFVHPLLFFIHVHVVKYSSMSWYIIC